MPSHYDTLQVIPTASDAVIKAAYRALAHIYHPDLNPHNADAEAFMQDINRAYHILSNPSSRAQYDIQNGLRDFYPDVVEATDSAAEKTAPNKPSAAAPSRAAAHQYAQAAAFRHSSTILQPAKWALRLFFFAAAAIFSLMAVAKWMLHSNPDLAVGARAGEVQTLKLRLDTAPLSLPD